MKVKDVKNEEFLNLDLDNIQIDISNLYDKFIEKIKNHPQEFIFKGEEIYINYKENIISVIDYYNNLSQNYNIYKAYNIMCEVLLYYADSDEASEVNNNFEIPDNYYLVSVDSFLKVNKFINEVLKSTTN